MLLRLLCTFAALWCWGRAEVLSAQMNAPAAEALFRAGRDAARRGDPRTACEKLRESYRLEAAIGTLLNIAVCEEALGELANAWQHYQEVVHGLDGRDERVKVARSHLEALEPRLPRLIVQYEADATVDDATVWIDGVQLGTASLGEALPIDVGSHMIEVRAAGRESRVFPIDVQEGERRVVEINVGAPRAAPPVVAEEASQQVAPVAPIPVARAQNEVPRQPAPSHEGSPVGTWIAFGIAGAGLITSGVTTWLWLDRAATVDAHCNARKACDDTGLAAASEGQAFFVTSLVAVGVTLVGAGVGVYLLSDTREDEAHTWNVAPVLGRDRAGVSMAARF